MLCPHCHLEHNTKEIKQLIREELQHLDPDVAKRLLDQLATRLGRSIHVLRGYQIKNSAEEVAHDEY